MFCNAVSGNLRIAVIFFDIADGICNKVFCRKLICAGYLAADRVENTFKEVLQFRRTLHHADRLIHVNDIRLTFYTGFEADSRGFS
jgi:hypothetical protein